jgi:hypothetical protein
MSIEPSTIYDGRTILACQKHIGGRSHALYADEYAIGYCVECSRRLCAQCSCFVNEIDPPSFVCKGSDFDKCYFKQLVKYIALQARHIKQLEGELKQCHLLPSDRVS